MDIKQILAVLDKFKGKEIVCLDVGEISSICNYIVICTGTSIRQIRALAENLHLELKKSNEAILGVEGAKDSQWILVDCNFAVVHCMTRAAREYYDLEGLWPNSKRINFDGK